MQYEQLNIEKVYFFNNKNGFFAGVLDDGRKIKGNAAAPPIGKVMAYGTWGTYYDKYEKKTVQQFDATTSKNHRGRIFYTSTKQAYLAMIVSGYIPGIGPKKAISFWDELGDECFNVLDAAATQKEFVELKGEVVNPIEALQRVSGIGKINSQAIAEEWLHTDTSELQYDAEAMTIGLNKAQTTEAKNKWGGVEMVEIIRYKPYMLTTLRGWTWDDSDILAQAKTEYRDPVGWNSVQRLAAALREVLRINLNKNGHTCMPVDAIHREANALARPTDKTAWNAVYENLIAEGLYRKDGYITTYPLYAMERDTASMLIDLMKFPVPEIKITRPLLSFTEKDKLDKKQEDAILAALSNNVSIITGGPGTGKTAVLEVLINIFEQSDISYTLGSFTANAARRMTEATGRDASTLHRIFGFIGDEDFNSIQLQTDVLVIDEASMLSSNLFYRVLSKLPLGTRLIIIGDIDQLPPVGAGEPMAEMMRSGIIPSTRLVYDWRNNGRDIMAEAAQRILSGKLPEDNWENGGYVHVETRDIERGVVKSVQRLLDLGVNIDDIQVLTPINKGKEGRVNLSTRVLDLVNDAPELYYPNGKNSHLRLGARVLHLRNNKDKGVVNGDVGHITDVYTQDDGVTLEEGNGIPLVTVKYSETKYVNYDTEIIRDITLDYAKTVHKSQGAEYPYVIIALPDVWMATRTLLFTAVSRKSVKAITVGERRVLKKWINNDTRSARYTRLSHYLQIEESEQREYEQQQNM